MTVVRDTTTSHDVSTDAAFRAWGLAIRTALTGAGIVDTADTGHIDFSSVSAPSTSAYAGFDVFRFNDAAQSGDPIFFKVEYGRGNANARPAVRVTVGTATDGAGTLTNPTSAFSSPYGATPSGTPELHVCHVDGTLVLYDVALATGGSTGGVSILIERLRDSAGAVITSGANKGWTVVVGIVGTFSAMRKGGSLTASPAIQAFGAGSGADPDGKKRLSSYVVADNYPGIGLVWAKSGEVAAGDSGAASVFGVSRTYKVATLAAANMGTPPNFGPGTATACVCCLLNE